MKELKKLVIQWAEDKQLLENVTPDRIEKQSLKVLEELGETAGAYLKNNQDELVDGIGDIAVTLIILSAMRGHDIDINFEIERKKDHLLLSISECLVFYIGEKDNHFNNCAFSLLRQFSLSVNYDLEHCLLSAYNVISKRTGVIKNGTFIKDV